MTHTPLRPQDIEVFTEAITHYFSASTGELASVRSAYLLERGGPVIWNDFNGLIEISGDYQGSVCFSAPRALLSHVLLKMGELVFSDERHGDIVGEIANTLSGRARHEPVSTSDTTSRGRCIAWYDATIATIDTRISDTQ